MLYPVELRAHKNSIIERFCRVSRTADYARLDDDVLVGEEGFEPPTSCSQSRRATRLRYTPRHRFLTACGFSKAGHNTLRHRNRQTTIIRHYSAADEAETLPKRTVYQATISAIAVATAANENTQLAPSPSHSSPLK